MLSWTQQDTLKTFLCPHSFVHLIKNIIEYYYVSITDLGDNSLVNKTDPAPALLELRD